MKTEFVYETPAKFKECHASTIVEAAPGVFRTAWFGGDREGSDNTEIWSSELRGSQWSDPVILGEEKRAACWNPVLFKDSGGTVWLFFKIGKKPDQWSGAYRTSSDNGKTWGDTQYMPAGLLGPVRCKPIELKDGTIICGTSVESYGSWSSWMELIRDGGKSWTRVGPITLPGHRMALIQPTVWEVKPGHLRTFMRSHQPIDRICQSDSMDNGLTWSDAKTTSLPNNNSGVDAVKLKDGRVVLIYNHLTRKSGWSGSRKEIHLNVSTDGGDTWGEPYMIEGKGKEYSYPAIIQAADGTIHMTYTWNRVKLRHLTVSPDELKGLIPH